MKKLSIQKIVKENIFCADYNNLKINNLIDFSDKNISVVYGPNGIGKTSLAMVFNQEPGTEYTIEVDGIKATEKDNKIFHIIFDQNGRNLIEGKTDDFLLGDNIKREFELKDKLEKGFTSLFDEIIIELKNSFGISTKNSNFDAFIKNLLIRTFISDLANNKSKGKNIPQKEFLSAFKNLKKYAVSPYTEDNLRFFINDLKNKDSVILILYGIKIEAIKPEPNLAKMEETSDAVKILEKYDYLNDCIVCDNYIEREKQLIKKQTQNIDAQKSLSEQTKRIIEKIITRIGEFDPFQIKAILKIALLSGKTQELLELIQTIKSYESIFEALISNYFIDLVQNSGLIEIHDEYSKLILEKPEFEEEDVIFIERFLNECLERKIHLERDGNNNLRILLGDQEFLNKNRQTLKLSNGEQNFLSLSFELLKAKKTQFEVIILDDPISSFDSIYKNKIAYSLIKFLLKKKTLVLTHSIDLIKLLEHQHKDCFNLYYLNNTIDENNGFFYVNNNEIKLLLYTHEFLNLLRGDIKNEIINEKEFLISITPFMRGYSQLINNSEIKNGLTTIMHGYETQTVDLTNVYGNLFSNTIINDKHIVSALDIISTNIDDLSIIKDDNYPLLSRTLKHSFTYLYLRLTVEKVLVDKFQINTKKFNMLSDIIIEAFKGFGKNEINNRIFFLSRKTLLNEFNHFEMDMNIFQPAFDITNRTLRKEKEDILRKLSEL